MDWWIKINDELKLTNDKQKEQTPQLLFFYYCFDDLESIS